MSERALELSLTERNAAQDAYRKFAVWWFLNQLRMAGLKGIELRVEPFGDSVKYILNVPLPGDLERTVFTTLAITYDRLLPRLPEEFIYYGKMANIVIRTEIRGKVGVVEVL